MRLLLRDLCLTQGAFKLQLDLEVEGKAIGIFGPSGAGKTSLLEVIAGLRRPKAGMLQIDDLSMMNQATRFFLPPERRGVGYVPQDLALFPHLSVRQNLLYGSTVSSLAFPTSEPKQIIELLEIGSLLDLSIGQLSGGQQQRVAFARALLARPRLLLMDEPLASLDQELKQKILDYLQRIREQTQIPLLYASHSPEEIVALCDQVLLIKNGSCIGFSRPQEVFETSRSVALRPGIMS